MKYENRVSFVEGLGSFIQKKLFYYYHKQKFRLLGNSKKFFVSFFSIIIIFLHINFQLFTHTRLFLLQTADGKRMWRLVNKQNINLLF